MGLLVIEEKPGHWLAWSLVMNLWGRGPTRQEAVKAAKKQINEAWKACEEGQTLAEFLGNGNKT
jgi:mannose/cellobiose epimerase-like protein (N-acyl-D-glucosamine 2-epimerase family)